MGKRSKVAKTPLLTNSLYDKIKFLAQIALPAFGTLYFTLAGLWGLPAADGVVGTVVAVDTFLGVLLGLSTKAFVENTAGGVINVVDSAEKTTFDLVLDGPVEDLVDKAQVIFKVNKPQ